MNKQMKVFYYHETKKQLPAYFLLAFFTLFLDFLPAFTFFDRNNEIFQNIKTITIYNINIEMLVMLFLVIGLTNFLSFQNDKKMNQVKNLLVLPYTKKQRSNYRLISFIINMSALAIFYGILISLVLFISKTTDVSYVAVFNKMLVMTLWTIVIFLYYSLLQNITGKPFGALILGVSIIFSYVYGVFWYMYNRTIYLYSIPKIINKISMYNEPLIFTISTLSITIIVFYILNNFLVKKYSYENTGRIINIFSFKKINNKDWSTNEK